MIDQARRNIDDVPRPLTGHLSHCRLRNAKEATEVGANRVREIGFRVIVKWLTDEYTGVVYKGVYSAKLLNRFADNSFSNLRTRNIAGDCHDAWIARRFNRSRGGNYTIIPISKPPHEAGANTLRSAGYDHNFVIHDKPKQRTSLNGLNGPLANEFCCLQYHVGHGLWLRDHDCV